MKKRLMIVGMALIVLVAVAITVLYAVDMKLMAENKPVLFSTWGYDYAPPENLPEPPVLSLTDKDGKPMVKCLFGSYSWKTTKSGVFSDYPPPYESEYTEENTLTLNEPTQVFTDNNTGKIKLVKVYNQQEKAELKYDVIFEDNSVILDIANEKEYIVEITVEYQQGNVNYRFKVTNN